MSKLNKEVSHVHRSKKKNLIEAVLKVNNEATLIELETVLKKAKPAKNKRPFSAHDFLGTWSKKDAALIEKAIEESCKQN